MIIRPFTPRVAPRVARVAATCLLALTTLSLSACKGRGDAAATDTAAGAVVPLADSATLAAADSSATTAAAAATTPAATKTAATKPASTPAKSAATASAPPPPPAPKVYPPFDSKASAASIGVHVYPKNNQVIAQQHFDENECFAWAKTNTGIDPFAPPTTAATPTAQQGGAVKGAAKGAVAGAAIGAIAGDAGKGAAIGATAGGVSGRRQQKAGNAAAATDAQAQAAATDAQHKKTFANGFSTCMDGRGYAVK